jgi:hydroxypyruvate isomerase
MRQMKFMHRRAFLSTLAAAAAASRLPAQSTPSKLNGLRLSITCDMFRGEKIGLPIDTPGRVDPRPQPRRSYTPDEALALTREQGYQAFEMFNWNDPLEWAGYSEAKRKYGLDCACIGGNKGVRAPGCGLVDPAEREGFLKTLSGSIEAAKKFGTERLVVLTGFEREGVPRQEQMESCVAGLRAAAPMLEKAGITAIVEPVNTRVTRPGYFLPSAREGLAMVRRVDSPNVKILFDIYHVQISDGDLIPQIRENIAWIGHFHIGDHPGRMQPGTGEINYRNVFRVIYEFEQSGQFNGYSALEYHPTVPLPQTMAEVRQLANFG